MKITFFKGKAKLAILAMLSAVVLGCAILLCCTLFNNNVNTTAKEDVTTTIDAPDVDIKSTASQQLYIPAFDWGYCSDSAQATTYYHSSRPNIYYLEPGRSDWITFKGSYGDTCDMTTNLDDDAGTLWGDGFNLSNPGALNDAPYSYYIKFTPIDGNYWADGTRTAKYLYIYVCKKIPIPYASGTTTFDYSETMSRSIKLNNYNSAYIDYEGNESISGGNLIIPAGASAGSHAVDLFPYDEGVLWTDGTDDTVRISYTINKANQGTPTISANASVDYNDYITLTASGGSSGSYTWTVATATGGADARFGYSTSATATTTSGRSVRLYGKQAGGTVTVTLTTDSNTNFNASASVTKTITVNKIAQSTPSISGNSSVNCNSSITLTASGGNTSSYTWSVATATGGATASLNKTTGSSVSLTGTAGGGTVKVTMYSNSGTNYNQSTSVTKTITINKLSQGTPSISGNASVNYDGTITLTASGGSTGSYTWSVATATGGATASFSTTTSLTSTTGSSVTLKGTRAGGTVTVTLYASSSSVYNQSSSTTKTITINKATPTATASLQSGTWYIGNTLSTVGISGTASVTGSFDWTKPTTELTASGKYGWTFTPTDTTNYNTVTGELTVTAVAKLTSITLNVTNQTYKAYESFTTAGLTVTANGGGGSQTVTDYTYTTAYTSLERNYFLVSDSGSVVTISYTEGGVTKTADIAITVIKADYDMSGVTFEDVTTTYDTEIHSITLSGTMPTGVTFTGTYNYDGVAGKGKTDAGRYEVSPVFTISDSANYNVPTMSAILLINKATPVVTVSISDGTFYVGDNLSVVAISLESSNVTGTLDWTTPTSKLSGLSVQYGWTFVPEETKNYENATGNVTVVAVYKLDSISVTDGNTNYSAFDELDEDSIVITATYVSGKNATTVTGWTYTYPGSTNYFTVSDDGKKVTFTYTENGIKKTCEMTVTVGKKTVDMTGVSMTNANETYTGNPYSIEVEGTLPEVLELNGYLYNDESATSATDAGTYVIKAQFTLKDSANYVMPELSATLTIGKATPVISVTGVKTNYTYNGEVQTVSSGATVNNTEQTVEYRDNTFTTVAEGNDHVVTVFVKESKNYKAGSETVTLTVGKAQLTLEWTGGNGDYDGKEHNATLTVAGGVFTRDDAQITTDILKNHITITYTTENGDDARIKVGTYAPAFTGYPDSEPFCNYTYVVSNEGYTFTIAKASAGTIKFEDATVTYDGEKHYLTITGELPDEVKVEYFVTGLSTKFEGATDVNLSGGNVIGYKVTAKFTCSTGNYTAPAEMNAVLTITPKTLADGNVTGIEESYVYNGSAQKPEPTVKLILTDGGEEITLSVGKDYKVTYSTETPDAGTTVQVTVTGTGNYDGTVTRSFEITKKTLNVVWVGENDKYTYTGSAQGVSAKLEGIVKSDEATVIPTITYVGRGATEYGESSAKPVNAGYYTVSVSLDATFKNYESFDLQTKNFQIEQAELTVTVEFDGYNPDTDTLYMGGALPDIKVISATFNGNAIAGELSWVDVSLHEKATDNYTWQYAPNDSHNFKTFTAVISLNAVRAPIERIEAVLVSDAPDFYVTTTFDTLRNYIIVTGYFAGGNDSTEIKGYTLNCDRFDELPTIADVYQLDISYNGKTCQLEVEYKAIAILSITVTSKNPDGSIKKNYEGYDELDRTGIIVTAERNDGYKWVLNDDEYVVEYVSGNNYFTVGETYVTISYGTGANRKAEEIDGITVERKQFDLSNISFNDETVTYDGTVKTASIKGAFLNGTIEYQYWQNGGIENVGSGVTDAGTYEVKAVFTFTDAADKLNYKPVTLTMTLTIEKAIYGSVTFNNISADYNYGNSLSDLVKVEGVDEDVELTFAIVNKTSGQTLSSLDDIKNAGTYEITVSFKVDGNHMPINDKKATFTVNKLKPTLNPQWRGNLTQGTKLYKIMLEAGENEIAGTYEWKNGEFELEAGLNRCSYVFTPEDTVNFEVVTSYLDLPVVGSQLPDDGTSNGSIPDYILWVLAAIVAVVLLVAIIALIVSVKASKNRVGDTDGFYDSVELDD